jgi:hypothetical protein
VPILKIENMGTSMAIDGKQINNSFYTVLTNSNRGKVPWWGSENTEFIGKCLNKLKDKLLFVNELSRDLSAHINFMGIRQKVFL